MNKYNQVFQSVMQMRQRKQLLYSKIKVRGKWSLVHLSLGLTDSIEAEFPLSGIRLRSVAFFPQGHQMAVVQLSQHSCGC